MRALDLFAGAGGWDVAAQQLGIAVDGVEIMPAALATRDAAGLTTVCHDVRHVLDGRLDLAQYDLLIASPPCQSFSTAGNGAGRAALAVIIDAIFRLGSGQPVSYDDLAGVSGDERAALVVEPLRVALAMRPTYVAWEQVPPVLPIWEACADVLRTNGYSVATGNIGTEQFGVPQTRRRAILVARRDGYDAHLPLPTHSRYYQRHPEWLDGDTLPWVSMADAIGWGMTARPSMTVLAGGADSGGATPISRASRAAIHREHEAGRWRENPAGGETLSVRDVAALQTFPADYPWRGTKTRQYQQIGNAFPPRAASAVLAEITSRPAIRAAA